MAVLTPAFSAETFWRYALIGIYVGVIPVALGLLWYPFLRRLGSAGMDFVLALTVGLLVFLVVDTLLEAVEVAGRAARGLLRRPAGADGWRCSRSSGCWGPSGCSGGAGRRAGSSTSYRIALGIGLHNLGEGLAIGAAFALGEAALGTFLVVGFTLHNITEGVGIAAPILKERPRLAHFAGLALLGGGPAIVGTWIGGFAYSNLALCRVPRCRGRGHTPGRLRGHAASPEGLGPVEDPCPLRPEPGWAHRRGSDHVRHRPAGERVGSCA